MAETSYQPQAHAPAATRQQRDTDLLIAFLAARDVPCPSCTYNLRGLQTNHCPECNQELALRVNLTEPRLAWFVAALTIAAGGLGFCSLILAWIGYFTLTRRSGPPLSDLYPMMVGTVIGAALVLLLIAGRRSISRRSSAFRWRLVAAVGFITMICPIWFIATVR